MIAPSNSFIEAAQDRLRDILYLEKHKLMLESQRHSYFSACPNASDTEYVAYATGLEAARIYLEGNLKAVQAGVSL